MELYVHDIEKAYPWASRGALWGLLLNWGCDPSFLQKCCSDVAWWCILYG